MKIGLALTFGILYWLATNKLWYGTLHLVRQPIVLAVPIGLIMGNLPDAMIMGASLQMIYLGAIAPGGTLPSDEALSSCIAIPLALQAGLDPSIAVTLAVVQNFGIRFLRLSRLELFLRFWHCCLV